eukprot:8189308-Lingulodinium_polyedra.AAC.1
MKEKFPDPDYQRGVIYIKNPESVVGVERVFQIPRGGRFFEMVQEGWRLAEVDANTAGNNPVEWLAEANSMELWSVQGLAQRELDGFLSRVSLDVVWDALLLQECSNFARSSTRDGHLVVASQKREGEKGRAIIIHRDWAVA